MSISGVLMAICAKLAYGGILFAATACMFFATRNFRIAEDKKEDKEDTPISPEGWGSDFNFDASSFENILNAGNVKFGQ